MKCLFKDIRSALTPSLPLLWIFAYIKNLFRTMHKVLEKRLALCLLYGTMR
jgi:hypothetical protein